MTTAFDRSEALRLARICVDGAATPGQSDRASALSNLLRHGLGYTMPDGSTARTWRTAYRTWTAIAQGHDVPRAGRPRGSRVVRLKLSAAARERLDASGDPSALVERLLMEV